MAHCKEFCHDYLILTPQEGGIYDLLHILWTGNAEKNNYTDCPKGTKIKDFERRRLVFISVLAQKLLLSMTKPMASVGSGFEMWLNLLSCNGGLGGMFINLFKRKLNYPDTKSETFRSTLGYVDDRVELDESIECGDSRYEAALAIMAAKISYENEAFIKNTVTNQWKMEFLECKNFWNDYQGQLTTQAFMFRDKKPDSELIIVAFRGTPPFDAVAWSSDIDISWFELQNVEKKNPSLGKVHGGFMKALGLQRNKGWPKDVQQEEGRPVAYYTIREKLREMLKANEKAKFIITGHSLGGALAILFPLILAYHDEKELLDRMEGVYTYGQPRVGDKKLGEYMEEKLSEHNVQYVRSVYGNDMVPRLPYDDSTQLFKHFGTCLYYNSMYEGKVVDEEPNKNYFSAIMVIPKILNAVWELGRSFVMPHIKGPEYEERWLLTMFRLIGLIIPGIPAHTTHEYVNCTRLRSSILAPEPENPNNSKPKFD